MTDPATEARLVELESLLARQERLLDDLNAEVLRLNRLHERLLKRFEEHEAHQDEAADFRLLADEPPPPHY